MAGQSPMTPYKITLYDVGGEFIVKPTTKINVQVNEIKSIFILWEKYNIFYDYLSFLLKFIAKINSNGK